MAKVTITFETKPAPWRGEVELGEAGIKNERILVLNGKEVGTLVSWYGNIPYGLFLTDDKGQFAQRIEIADEKSVVFEK